MYRAFADRFRNIRLRQFVTTCSGALLFVLSGVTAAQVEDTQEGVMDNGQNGTSAPYGNDAPGQPAFSDLDQDADGVISPNEAAQSEELLQQFTDADANQDGFIDGAEFAAFDTLRQTDPSASATPEVEFSDLDTNNDGYLSALEAEQDPQAREQFGQLDIDQDGQLSTLERSGLDQDSQPVAGSEVPSFTELDSAADGQITYEEAQQSPLMATEFERWDVNRDGIISREEFAAFETMQGVQPELEPESALEAPPIDQPPPIDNNGRGETPGAAGGME